MEKALRAKLLAHGALAALIVGVSSVDRPEGRGLPWITLTLISRGRGYAHDGWDGLNDSLVQADIWAAGYNDLVPIAVALTDAMEAQETVSGWSFAAAFLESEHDWAPEDIPGGGTAYRRMTEWRIQNSPSS